MEVKSIGSIGPIPLVSRSTSRIAWGIFIALFIIGGYGLADRLINGHIHANYGSLVPWGLWVAFYIYCIGISAGAFLISSLVYVFGIKKFERAGPLSLFIALVTLFIALLGVNIDLGHQFRSWKVIFEPNFKSSITWIVWFYLIYVFILILELYYVLKQSPSPEERQRDRKAVKVIGTIGIPVAMVFHGAVGTTLGVLIARPLWHTGIMPVLFISAALASGGALLTFIVAFFTEGRGTDEHRELVSGLGKLVLSLFVVYTVMEFSDILVGSYQSIPQHLTSYTQIVGGSQAWSFWLFVVIGLLVPMLLIATKPNSPNIVGAGCLLMTVCFLSARYHLVVSGFAGTAFPESLSAYHDKRWATDYMPSIMEWLSVIGITGIGGILFLLGYKYLPLQPGNEDV
jgi:molybdopterin-containing oxidoreductase family membrane subunit